jgi:hypothetical protein
MIYKLKRYSKSTIPMRKPDIKFRDNNIKKNQYNNLEEPEEEKIIYEEPQYEEEPQESSEDLENYYIEDEND